MEAIEISEENVPPSKKLKQAKLSFFKAVSPTVKTASSPMPNQGIKRKLASESESPSKVAKLCKPLIQAVHNTEMSPNIKVACGKLTKLPSQKSVISSEDHDQEVSSSSEADSVQDKKGGRRCLMDNYVKKIPKDGHQEISSTNEVLDISAELCETDKNEEDEMECIILEEVNEKISVEAMKVQNSISDDINNDSQIESVDKFSAEELTAVKNVEEGKPDIFTPKKINPIEKQEVSGDSTPKEKADIGSPNHMSTPLTAKSNLNASPSSSGETPKAVTSAKKRVRKVNPAKQAELEKKKQEKEKEREEKKRQLEEEKAKKEQARRELKEAKEKEKQQQKEKLEKERLEKQKIKEEEKKKKEEERLQKEEEKKKVFEAKQEEKRKKDEEKRLKEEEKRLKEEEKRIQEEEKKLKEEEKQKEEEKKKKKAEKTKQAFQSFFIKPKEQEQKPSVVESSTSIFFPFQLKKDMHLAPSVRNSISDEKKDYLDQYLQSAKVATSNYLDQLKSKELQPCKTGRIPRKNPEAEEVEIIHDTEALKKAFHQVKLLQFHTDVRPPYYGTWKKTTSLNPRNPWYKDEATFDYEIDSEEEWEEEEPGESLSCSEGEEGEEKGEEGADEDEEDGWMVPHGYLSEDEGCNDDDEITPEKLKMQQQAKAKAWEMEQKRKLQAAPVITVGCFFEHSPSQSMSGDVRLLYEFKGIVIAPVVPIRTSQLVIEDTCTDQEGAPSKNRGGKKREVPAEAMPHLIQLVHGNTCGLKRLVREFRVFWLKKHDQPSSNGSESLNDSGDISMLNDSTSEPVTSIEGKECTEKGDNDEIKQEEGYGCSISKRQLEKKIMSIGVREKRPGFNLICWYVHAEVLSQWKMDSLSLPNTWVFSSSGPSKSPKTNLNKNLNESKNNPSDSVENEKEISESKLTDQRSIIAFTMSKEEIMKQESLKPKPEPKLTETMEVEEDKVKKPFNDQRSIMTFTKTKEELSLLSSKRSDQISNEQSEQKPLDASSSDAPVLKDTTTVAKTPVSEKKSKVSIMDLLMKKSSACKKKLPTKKDQVFVVSNSLDSDVEIIEEIPSKRGKESPLKDNLMNVEPDSGAMVAMDVDAAQSDIAETIPQKVGDQAVSKVNDMSEENIVKSCFVKVEKLELKKVEEAKPNTSDIIVLD